MQSRPGVRLCAFTLKVGTEGTDFRQEWERLDPSASSPQPGGQQGALVPIEEATPPPGRRSPM